MSEWMTEYAMFLAQTLTLVLALGALILLLMKGRGDSGESVRLKIEELNTRQQKRVRRLRVAASEKGQRKALLKGFRKSDKARQKERMPEQHATVWVLDFHGDIKASGTSRLAQEISAILDVVEKDDEVVIRLESAGGLVHAYGLAAAQLDRLREAGIATRICVDKVAASGGYMMACCADRLQVAPFAVLGSIGVVAQLPNVHRLLKRNDIDMEIFTAGRYKRTLTVLGENTEEGREKFVEDLERTHELFKSFVAARRPQLSIDEVATGEIWYGCESLERKLADEVATSAAYLHGRLNDARVLMVQLEAQKKLPQRLGLAVSRGIESAAGRLLEVMDASRWLKR
ncbi:protease SohB [Pistricoccus aurantiacus]|uniref:Protease SohB n=1 Tax=Pistricoccus aurantiacus TaxID=1883414 RepID=A0A5B8SUN0_9GAMM|nr:protease SohB [Pistricoccus aurantiacus]QEA40031.1 protease SohB [Pistricoccus aurantiacus]